MGNFTYEKQVDKVFGNCIYMTNGHLELKVAIDFGPRVLHLSCVGKENMLYNDTKMQDLDKKFDIFDSVAKCYGGHRLWVSPEVTPRCYYPDNYPVEFVEIPNGIEFIAPVEKHNEIQKSFAIIFGEDKEHILVEHYIKNCGVWDVEIAPWTITMMAAGSKEIMPMATTETGLLPNRNFTFWDYSKISDERVHYGEKYITLQQTEKVNPYKIGYNNVDGWGAVFNKGQVFIKFFEPNPEGEYPDNGCSYESYTNGVMLEAETLGEIELVMPDETITHIEEWFICEESKVPSNDEQEITDILSKYINL